MSSLRYPLPQQVRVTQGFGAVTAPTFRAHNGVDLGATCGTPILAAGAGVVSKAITGAAALANIGGREIHIRHSDGVTSVYAHASALYVKQGDTVAAGQPIGAVGASGLATGCHLHFQLDVNGKAIDPGPSIGIGPTGKGSASAVSVDNTGQATLATAGTDNEAYRKNLTEDATQFIGKKTWNEFAHSSGFELHGLADPFVGASRAGSDWTADDVTRAAASLGILDQTITAEDIPRVVDAALSAGAGKIDPLGSLFSLVLPPLLEPALNLAILGFAGLLIYTGVREVANAAS